VDCGPKKRDIPRVELKGTKGSRTGTRGVESEKGEGKTGDCPTALRHFLVPEETDFKRSWNELILEGSQKDHP